MFLQEHYQGTFSADTELRNENIDGDDAVELLNSLEKEFNVNFKEFDFNKYFLEEIEISKGLSWFGLIKIRKVQAKITVQELFQYMIQNRIS